MQYLGYKIANIILTAEIVKEKIIIQLVPDDNQLDEVVVTNDSGQIIKMSENVSQISLSPKKLASIPNLGEKDIFRSIQLLPGVSGTNESSSGSVQFITNSCVSSLNAYSRFSTSGKEASTA